MTTNIKRTLFGLLAISGLILTIIPSILVFIGIISLENHKTLMFIGLLFWFSGAPFWMKKT